MSYREIVKKTLKVKSFSLIRPSNISSYNVGAAFTFRDNEYVYFTGNLSDLSLTTHTNSNDTIILPSGRYFIQANVPVPELAYVDSSSTAYIEWQNFYSNSLNGTYNSFGTKGRNNPGDKPGDTGDNAGVHSYSSGIVESSNTIYLQVRVVTNSNFTSIPTTTTWSYPDQIIIWRAD